MAEAPSHGKPIANYNSKSKGTQAYINLAKEVIERNAGEEESRIRITIFNMPYTILISVIIGITNIIPFFGPFIGAIPSGILILTVDPMQALYFAIFIYFEPYNYFGIKQSEYKRTFMGGVVRNYFANSYKEMVSFFAKEQKLSAEDLKDIIDLIEKGKDK